MSPRCRVCGRHLNGDATRWQMTRRAPQDPVPVRLWWLCDTHIAAVEDAIDTIADLYFGPGRELQPVGGIE